jgi:outer membrane protein assembly factor BamD (BamD/ComL family)
MSHRPLVATLLAAAWLTFSGCAMFRSPDPDDIPKSRYDVDPDDVANGTDPEKHRPLIDPDKFSEANIRRNFKKLIGRGANRDAARDHYAKGTATYEDARRLAGSERQQKFVEAAKEFVNAADRWPDTSLEQDALFMAGDCYFFADYYVEANRQFELLVKKYPNSRHLDVVQARRFLIAKYWLDQNDNSSSVMLVNFTDVERPWIDARGNALRVYDKIRIDDPTGKLADDATLAAGMERFKKREFVKADEYFSDLIAAYPNSEHQYNAHYFGLKAKLNSYRGADYAGASLDEGEKLIKQMRRQFPNDARQDREFLDKSFAEIRFKKAERFWKMAQYYDRRWEYGGARYYYDIVTREYDDTPFGPRAEERLREIGDAPDRPKQPLKWLVDLFPESDPLQPILNEALVEPAEEGTADLDVQVRE